MLQGKGGVWINTRNIWTGMVVKNHEVLCGLLGLDAKKGGNSKKAQVEEFKRFFTYTRDGHKYVIGEVFKEPDLNPRDTLYTDYIKYILAYELSHKDGYKGNYTRTKLYEALGMINSCCLSRSHPEAVKLLSVIPDDCGWQVTSFLTRSRNRLSDILDPTLSSMKKKGLLAVYADCYRIVDRDDPRYIRTTLKGDGDYNKIMDAEREIEYKIKLADNTFYRNYGFYNRVNALLSKRYGFGRVYKAVEIEYEKKHLEAKLAGIRNDVVGEIDNMKVRLNSNVVTAINAHAEKMYEKNISGKTTWEEKKKKEDEEWGCNSFSDEKYFEYGNNYIENQKKLAEIFLRIEDNKMEGGDKN